MPFGRWSTERPAVALRLRSAPDALYAAARLEQALASQPTGTDWRWAALGRLVIGDAATAVQWFERASALAPADPGIACDLAGAYYIHAIETTHAEWIPRAIDAARRGISRDGQLPACWFNLGLSLRHAGLLSIADDAFAAAARLESGPWSVDAAANVRTDRVDGREQIARLLEPIVATGDLSALEAHVAEHLDVIEELLQRRLLTDWAKSIRQKDLGSATALRGRAQALAARLHAANGDRHPIDLVSQFDRCDTVCAAGWIDHVAAMVAWEEWRIGDARRASASADSAFGTRPTPINAARLLVRVTLARIDGAHPQAAAWLRSYRAFVEDSGYLLLGGRMAWQLGLLQTEAGDFGGAVALYRHAADWLGRARDREGAAMVDSLLAEQYQQLGDFRQAWAHALAALSRFAACRDLRQRAILAATAVLATANQLDEAAMALRRPVLDHARRTATAPNLVRLLAEDATTLLRLGRLDAARDRLDEATQNLGRIDDPGTAAMSAALVHIARARLLAIDRPAEAIPVFEAALAIYGTRGNRFAVPVLELERGRALLRLGAMDQAERAFLSGITAAERQRQSSSSDAERVGLLSARWDLFTSVIDLQLRRKNEAAALRLLDRARAVNLLEAVGASAPVPTTLSPGVVALEYVALESGIHAWVTMQSGRRHFRLSVTVDTLERQVQTFRRALIDRRTGDEVRRLSRELFTVLFEGVETAVASASHLVIVPDGPLSDVPFAALEDPSTGKGVIDHAAITVTPSLRLYVHEAAAPAPRPPYDIVAVGNPRAADTRSTSVANLPGADREARAVASLYRRRSLLRGADVTKRRFLEVAPSGRVLHFAGHAIADPQAPGLSRLLVAPSAGDAVGAVFATDISRLNLRGVRLVILSGCETAAGRRSRGDGVISLARAFLSAGVPSVIATLWPIDDERGADLAQAIHVELLRGRPASEALRHAQLSWRGAPGAHAGDWAGAIVLGRDVTATERSCERRCIQ